MVPLVVVKLVVLYNFPEKSLAVPKLAPPSGLIIEFTLEVATDLP